MSAVHPADVRLLIDEDLSPAVARRLCIEDGVDAIHVRDRGMLRANDHRVLEYAFEQERVLVTANAGDFKRLARARGIHAGIVLLLESDLSRDEQLAVVRKAVAAIIDERSAGRDMVNRVLRVSTRGSMVLVDLPEERARG